MKVKKIRIFLNKVWENDWTPAGLLAAPRYVRYNKPVRVSGGFLYGPSTEYGYMSSERTTWGKWLDEQPAAVALGYLIVHYIVFGALFVVVCPSVGFVKLIYNLLTKKWGDL